MKPIRTSTKGTAMTDSEFWAVMAETVEQAKTMPNYVHTGPWPDEPCFGLCAIVSSAHNIGLIDDDQRERLREQVSGLRPDTIGFFWREAVWPPRVKAMRRLAKQAAR